MSQNTTRGLKAALTCWADGFRSSVAVPRPYKRIARVLKRALPRGWAKTWVWSEMSERDGSVVVYYIDAAQKVGWISPPLALYDRFRELNNAARRADPRFVWTSATFALDAHGAIVVDYAYDPIPIEDEEERRVVWKKRYLPNE